MKKHLRRVLILVLAAALAVSMTGTSFAAGSPSESFSREEIIEQIELHMEALIQAELIQLLESPPVASISRDSCDHLTATKDHSASYVNVNSSQHRVIIVTWLICPKCGITKSISKTTSYESHSFGPASFVSSNHSSSNYREHYAVYEYACIFCRTVFTRQESTGCTAYTCQDPQSVEPPEVTE